VWLFSRLTHQAKNSQTGIMTIVLTPLCYAYLAGSIVLFAVWLVFFLARKDLHKEMLTMSVLIGVLSVVTGYVWWTVEWWKPPTITHTEPDETDVHAVMTIPFARLGRAALALIGKFPAEEQSSNLHRLKEVLETGRLTDTSYSVPGKFA